MTETQAHRQLKRFAIAFLRRHGCLAVATEVACSIPRYRADVAGYLDVQPRDADGPPSPGKRRRPPRTIIIECKQSRGDFLTDCSDRDKLLQLREHLERMCLAVEEQTVKVHEPHLRTSGSSLFPEMEHWDFSGSKLASYRDLLRRLAKVDEQLYGQTKFCLLARYRLADRLYVAAPRGVIRPRELPTGWGLLECAPGMLDQAPSLYDMAGESPLRMVARARPLHCAMNRRMRLLRNIAVAASRAAFGA